MHPSGERPSRRSSKGRLWRLMEALTHDPGESFEGHSIIREVPGAFGIVLWQAARDVALWAVVENRAGLFAPGAAGRRRALLAEAAPPDELDAALGVLTGLAGFPEEASPDALALACGRVARWAEARESLATALAFAQAASVALPRHSATALEAGRVAVRRGDAPRAEVWLRRAVGLARRDGDGATSAFAYAELGDLFRMRGADEAARRMYVKAMRVARRRAIYMARGRAFYGLGLIEQRAGRPAEAERLLRAAWRPLGEGHPLRTRVSYALAELAVRQGRPESAAETLAQLLITTDAALERLRLRALLALCAAQAGNVPRVARVWNEAYELADRLPASEDKAVALLDLSRAAALARNRAWSHMAADRALAAAQHVGAAGLAEEAARLRDDPLGVRG